MATVANGRVSPERFVYILPVFKISGLHNDYRLQPVKQIFLTTYKLRRCLFSPITLRMAKNSWSFGHSECKRVKFLMSKYTHSKI